MASTYTELESALETLVHKFYDYGKKHGKHDKINEKEFREMVVQELPHILTNTQSTVAIHQLVESLDMEQDGNISFDDYWTLIGKIGEMLCKQMAINYQEQH
ncbi:protein S100-A16-like [Leptodactylus fuscus]|uniref:protein S100-A16-like n=1 Tax=Leptodactylus fuscus TaxID=238119 RepID=UPI003F4E57F4